jgi:hypothetical protein
VEEGLFAQLQSKEPALLTALVTFVGGFLAQAGPGNVGTMKALGTSATISGLQGLLTRAHVFSPASVSRAATAATTDKSPLLDPKSPTPWLASGAEPSMTMAFVSLVAGFLLQATGNSSHLAQAFGVSAGLAGTQGLLTRQQVFSPRTVALAQLVPNGLAGLVSGKLGGLPFMGHVPGLATATPAPAAAAASGGVAPAPAAPPAVVATAAVRAVLVTSAPGATSLEPATEPGVTSLLGRFRPEVRYDSLESYYADSAAILTDRSGNLLKRQDGTVIAGAPGGPPLTLEFLAGTQYPGKLPVTATDYIDLVDTDYDASGARWLQYWFFMYYDNPGFLGFGCHEGDLEMIQLRLDANDQPDVVSYSQHRSGVRATWSQLELVSTPDGPSPVTYSARGSHANLLRAGISISKRSFLPDHNDGKGYRVRPALVALSEAQTPWCLWPGAWGGTVASGWLGKEGISANSPAAFKRHRAWSDPAGFHASCDLSDDLPPAGQSTGAQAQAPPMPDIEVKPSAGSTVVSFSVPPAGGPAATKLVAGIVSPKAGVPAITKTVDIQGTSGTIELPLPQGAGPFAVHATTHAESGVASATQTVALPAA